MKLRAIHLFFVFVATPLVEGPIFAQSRSAPGSLGQIKKGEEAKQEFRAALATSIRDQFARITGLAPKQFDLISFATQIVAGVNYFAKVQTDEKEFVHLRIFESLPTRKRPLVLTGVQRGKTLDEPVAYFWRNLDDERKFAAPKIISNTETSSSGDNSDPEPMIDPTSVRIIIAV